MSLEQIVVLILIAGVFAGLVLFQTWADRRRDKKANLQQERKA